MPSYQKLLAFAILLTLTGAGCAGFGTKKPTPPDGGIFKTTDAGIEWKQMTTIPGPKGVGTTGGTNTLALVMDPSDATILYAGTRDSGLLFTENAANSWDQSRVAAINAGAISAVAVDPNDTCTVYVAKGERLTKTTDCLRSFNTEVYVETRPGVSVSQIQLDWYNSNVLWMALSNGDLLKSEDAGKTWRSLNAFRVAIGDFLISNTDSRIVLVGLTDGGFWKSVDAGETWVQIDKNILKDFKNGHKVARLVQDTTASTVIAATGYGLLRSKDFGSTWEAIPLLTQPGQVSIRALAIDPGNANTIFYAAASTFYSTTTGGAPWATQKLPSTREPISLIVDPGNPSTLYLGVATPPKK